MSRKLLRQIKNNLQKANEAVEVADSLVSEKEVEKNPDVVGVVIDHLMSRADAIGYPTGENLVDQQERINRMAFDSVSEIIATSFSADQVAAIRDLCEKVLVNMDA